MKFLGNSLSVKAKRNREGRSHPDPAQRLYLDAEIHQKRREELVRKHTPPFAPTLNKKTQKIAKQINQINSFISKSKSPDRDRSNSRIASTSPISRSNQKEYKLNSGSKENQTFAAYEKSLFEIQQPLGVNNSVTNQSKESEQDLLHTLKKIHEVLEKQPQIEIDKHRIDLLYSISQNVGQLDDAKKDQPNNKKPSQEAPTKPVILLESLRHRLSPTRSQEKVTSEKSTETTPKNKDTKRQPTPTGSSKKSIEKSSYKEKVYSPLLPEFTTELHSELPPSSSRNGITSTFATESSEPIMTKQDYQIDYIDGQNRSKRESTSKTPHQGQIQENRLKFPKTEVSEFNPIFHKYNPDYSSPQAKMTTRQENRSQEKIIPGSPGEIQEKLKYYQYELSHKTKPTNKTSPPLDDLIEEAYHSTSNRSRPLEKQHLLKEEDHYPSRQQSESDNLEKLAYYSSEQDIQNYASPQKSLPTRSDPKLKPSPSQQKQAYIQERNKLTSSLNKLKESQKKISLEEEIEIANIENNLRKIQENLINLKESFKNIQSSSLNTTNTTINNTMTKDSPKKKFSELAKGKFIEKSYSSIKSSDKIRTSNSSSLTNSSKSITTNFKARTITPPPQRSTQAETILTRKDYSFHEGESPRQPLDGSALLEPIENIPVGHVRPIHPRESSRTPSPETRDSLYNNQPTGRCSANSEREHQQGYYSNYNSNSVKRSSPAKNTFVATEPVHIEPRGSYDSPRLPAFGVGEYKIPQTNKLHELACFNENLASKNGKVSLFDIGIVTKQKFQRLDSELKSSAGNSPYTSPRGFGSIISPRTENSKSPSNYQSVQVKPYSPDRSHADTSGSVSTEASKLINLKPVERGNEKSKSPYRESFPQNNSGRKQIFY